MHATRNHNDPKSKVVAQIFRPVHHPLFHERLWVNTPRSVLTIISCTLTIPSCPSLPPRNPFVIPSVRLLVGCQYRLQPLISKFDADALSKTACSFNGTTTPTSNIRTVPKRCHHPRAGAQEEACAIQGRIPLKVMPHSTFSLLWVLPSVDLLSVVWRWFFFSASITYHTQQQLPVVTCKLYYSPYTRISAIIMFWKASPDIV